MMLLVQLAITSPVPASYIHDGLPHSETVHTDTRLLGHGSLVARSDMLADAERRLLYSSGKLSPSPQSQRIGPSKQAVAFPFCEYSGPY